MLPVEIFPGEPRSSCRSRQEGSTRAGPGRGRGSWKNVLGATLKRPKKIKYNITTFKTILLVQLTIKQLKQIMECDYCSATLRQ